MHVDLPSVAVEIERTMAASQTAIHTEQEIDHDPAIGSPIHRISRGRSRLGCDQYRSSTASPVSVGIGFGLQSIVNNFVSGLILLAERPIKIGDLVVVGGEEGYVRKISVRSTEVETFEQASVVIPNSYFITEKVKNGTLRDNKRRIAIPVRVANGSDPRAVKSILLKVAQDHPSVLTLPAPSFDFEDFGLDGLTFKLYAFVDLRAGGNVAADLRIAILEAFQEAGILIPSRQAEVTLQTIDLLRETAEYLLK